MSQRTDSHAYMLILGTNQVPQVLCWPLQYKQQNIKIEIEGSGRQYIGCGICLVCTWSGFDSELHMAPQPQLPLSIIRYRSSDSWVLQKIALVSPKTTVNEQYYILEPYCQLTWLIKNHVSDFQAPWAQLSTRNGNTENCDICSLMSLLKLERYLVFFE